jgi:uncharacterized repeat protein (TIGR01451 family)
MKTWRRTTPAQATAVMAVGLIATPAVMTASHPSVSHTAPSASHTTPAARAPRGPGLAISISDGRVAARPGDKLGYTVTVRDTGTVAASRLTITQTLSTGLEFISASDHGVARNGHVSWSSGLPAGGTRTFLVDAKVTKTPATLQRLAAVVCVTLPGSSRPVVCAAHLDRLPAVAKPGARSSQSSTRMVNYAATGLAVLALGLLTAFAARRRGRTRRQPA